MDNNFFKFKDIKIYSSTEWLANNTKKYRCVFEQKELAYVYCEVSVFNKKFDEEDWTLRMQLKCFDEKNNEVCDLNCDRLISMSDNVAFIREGWGVKTTGAYWKPGVYKWEAWIGTELLTTKTFYVESVGQVKPGFNPYFKIETVKLYEGPDDNTTIDLRKYYTVFNVLSTKYVYVELNAKNLTRRSADLPIELMFNFRTLSGYLKGRVQKLYFVKPTEDEFSATIGWGSDIIGTWSRGD